MPTSSRVTVRSSSTERHGRVEQLADDEQLAGALLEAAQVEQAADDDAACVDRGDPGHRHEDAPPRLHLEHEADDPWWAGRRAQRGHDVPDLAELVAAGVEDRSPRQAGDEDSGGGAHTQRLPAAALLASDAPEPRSGSCLITHVPSLRTWSSTCSPTVRSPATRSRSCWTPRGSAAGRCSASRASSTSPRRPFRCARPRPSVLRAPTTCCGSSRPTVEVPFAGHPSVGTAWWLAHTGQIATGVVGQQCGVGLLPVEVTDDWSHADRRARRRSPTR